MRRTHVLVIAGSLVLAAPAHAQTGQDVATAQALFDDAKALMASGKYSDACPKLEESQRLDPGGGTLLALALCHEAQGRTATAWADFNLALTAARKDGRADREKAAEDHIHALEPKLSRLTIAVPHPAPQMQVTRDGTVMGAAEWGTALPVDPGDHKVEATAPGKKPWSTVVTAQCDGDKIEVTAPPLEDAPAPAPSTAPAAPPGAGGPSAAPPVTSGSDGGTQRTIGLVAAGIGIAGIAVGSFFGVQSFQSWGQAKSDCPNLACPSPSSPGFSAATSARTDAAFSTLFFTGGGVALAAGAVLYLLAPSPHKEAAVSYRVVPALGHDAASMAVEGSF